MERAWENPDLWVRSKAARDPRTPQEVLERLAADPSPSRRGFTPAPLAATPSTET